MVLDPGFPFPSQRSFDAVRFGTHLHGLGSTVAIRGTSSFAVLGFDNRMRELVPLDNYGWLTYRIPRLGKLVWIRQVMEDTEIQPRPGVALLSMDFEIELRPHAYQAPT